MAFGGMKSSQGQVMYEIIRASVLVVSFPPLSTVLSLSFCIVNAWPFIHFITVYRRLSSTDNHQQCYHICFTRVAYCTESSAVRTHERVLTFKLSVSAKTWHCGVHLIIIYFRSTPPHDHLVIKLCVFAASLMFVLYSLLQAWHTKGC